MKTNEAANFMNTLVELIVNRVNEQHPQDGKVRMTVYADLGERFTALARVFAPNYYKPEPPPEEDDD